MRMLDQTIFPPVFSMVLGVSSFEFWSWDLISMRQILTLDSYAGGIGEATRAEHAERCAKSEPIITNDDICQIEKWVQRHCGTTWHSLGTCSNMASKEGNSTVKHGVDERLNVHGVKNLKVVDLSICPDHVGCNTCSVSCHLPMTKRKGW